MPPPDSNSAEPGNAATAIPVRPRIDLSVIIVTRNTCSLTLAAIRSVFESRDDLEKEVVVVDNGSSDGTPEAVRAEFPEMRLLRRERNLGFAAANNLGAAATTGQLLLLLNSDARLNADTLSEAVVWMRQNPGCGVAGVQLLNADGSPQNSIANFPSAATELLNKSLLRRLFPRRFPGKESRLSAPIEVESVIGAFLLVRRSLWDLVGGLDERYFFFLEETDLCLQARRHGWKVFHLPQVQVWHGQGGSARQWPAAARIEYWRSRYAYFEKNHSRSVCGLVRMGLALRLAVDWLASGLLALLTFGRSPRWREKWRTNTALGLWHLRGCPAGAGLPR
ncbi:MAG TPA: glycosyltransferase family 2 protein [Verrucomicrobiae bacterium]